MSEYDWKMRTAQSPAYTRSRRPIAGTARWTYSALCSCGFATEWYRSEFIAEHIMKAHVKEEPSHE
jgi:hypothetical protein